MWTKILEKTTWRQNERNIYIGFLLFYLQNVQVTSSVAHFYKENPKTIIFHIYDSSIPNIDPLQFKFIKNGNLQ